MKIEIILMIISGVVYLFSSLSLLMGAADCETNGIENTSRAAWVFISMLLFAGLLSGAFSQDDALIIKREMEKHHRFILFGVICIPGIVAIIKASRDY